MSEKAFVALFLVTMGMVGLSLKVEYAGFVLFAGFLVLL